MQVPVERLTEFVAKLFEAVGIEAADATTTTRRLVEGDLRGRSGHGVIRVGPYIERIEAGGIKRRPDLRIEDVAPGAARVDGDNGLGPVIATRAAEIAIDKALVTGVAWVGTVRSNHAGAAGVYAAMAAEQGLIGIYMAVANGNAMAPWGGDQKLLGTNPIAIAVPSASGRPFVLDIATTTASHGSIRVAADAGERMPEGWVVDGEGNPVTDPAKADEGFLLPIGGYKGAGLNIAIGLLAGVMNGAAFGSSVVDQVADRSTPTNTGQVMMALRADLFGPRDEMLAAVEAGLEELRSGTSSARPLRLPGDEADARQAGQRQAGVTLSEVVVGRLDALAQRVGVPDRLASR